MAEKTLTRYVTGACSIGHHEGERHRNYKEQPMPFCRGQWVSVSPGARPYKHVCKCECHENITAMFEAVGKERIWPTSGQWWADDDEHVPEKVKFWNPYSDPTWADRKGSATRVMSSEVEEKRASEGELTPQERAIRRAIEFKMLPPNPDYVAATKAVAIADDVDHVKRQIVEMGLKPKIEKVEEIEGKSVRAAGQLEREVKGVCDAWTLGLLPEVFRLTVSEIAKAINPDAPPSTGAITNVLLRWHEIGFAMHMSSPHRFEGYTPEGIELGVNELQRRQVGAARTAKKVANHTFTKRPKRK